VFAFPSIQIALELPNNKVLSEAPISANVQDTFPLPSKDLLLSPIVKVRAADSLEAVDALPLKLPINDEAVTVPPNSAFNVVKPNFKAL